MSDFNIASVTGAYRATSQAKVSLETSPSIVLEEIKTPSQLAVEQCESAFAEAFALATDINRCLEQHLHDLPK